MGRQGRLKCSEGGGARLFRVDLCSNGPVFEWTCEEMEALRPHLKPFR